MLAYMKHFDFPAEHKYITEWRYLSGYARVVEPVLLRGGGGRLFLLLPPSNACNNCQLRIHSFLIRIDLFYDKTQDSVVITSIITWINT
jgi:hypothetical protein